MVLGQRDKDPMEVFIVPQSRDHTWRWDSIGTDPANHRIAASPEADPPGHFRWSRLKEAAV